MYSQQAVGQCVQVVKGPTKWLSRHRAFRHTLTGCGCSPDWQLGFYQDHPTKEWFGHCTFSRCSLNRQLDSQRYRQGSNLLPPGCSRLPSHLAPVSSISVLARNRTWSTSFASSRAIRHTPRTCCFSVPRQGVEPRLVVPKTTVRPSHSQGMDATTWPWRLKVAKSMPWRLSQVARPGVEPDPTASEAGMLSGTPTGRVVSTPTWTRTRTKTLGGSRAVRYTTGTQEPTTGFAPASFRLQGGRLSTSSHVGVL